MYPKQPSGPWATLLTSGPSPLSDRERAVPTPALKRPDKSIAFDDRKKPESLADSIERQGSENLPYDLEHVSRVEEDSLWQKRTLWTIWI
ncbi:hypothetical protein EVAR_10771_1 [Eumeta japonica]|uniref:Uncharacterized protein n=1 Tax=Eumeta variegata TaxID=151549 RepID=A0A4C1W716_EUMVA|nr:hypothetical protein EVAR_10771_1 [Eumeta japonica]